MHDDLGPAEWAMICTCMHMHSCLLHYKHGYVFCSSTSDCIYKKQQEQTIMSYPTRFIMLDKFDVDDSVEYVYRAPDEGKCTMNLLTKEDDIAFHCDVRYDWKGDVNILVFNSRIDGTYGHPEVRPSGFDFTPGVDVTVKIVGAENGFVVFCNGSPIPTEYKYPSGLTQASVVKVESFFDYYGTSTRQATQAKLHRISSCLK